MNDSSDDNIISSENFIHRDIFPMNVVNGKLLGDFHMMAKSLRIGNFANCCNWYIDLAIIGILGDALLILKGKDIFRCFQ